MADGANRFRSAKETFFLSDIVTNVPGLVLIFIGIAVLLLDWTAMIIALANSSYAPLRAKQLGLVALSLASGTLWFVGSLQGNNLLVCTGIMSYCVVWAVFVQIILGLQVYVGSILLRLYRLYRVIVQKLPARGWDYALWSASFFAPSIACSIVAFVLPAEYVNSFREATQACHFNPTFKIFLIVFGSIGVGVTGWFMWVLSRKVPLKSFNEYRENRTLFLVYLYALAVYMVVNISGGNNYLWGVMATCSTILFITHVNLWIVLYKPLKGFLFYHDAHLEEFRAGLSVTEMRHSRGSAGKNRSFQSGDQQVLST
ncbi:hypothetical protein BC831DRAFT_403695 [Entophlyctis helioformis]|nr:hypothetical protein BC831DRAFT_403695 [Entophlyctis helioformis]